MQDRRLRRMVWQVILVGAAAGVIAWGLYALKTVLLLLVLTIFFCYLIAPLVTFVERPLPVRWRLPRGLAILVVYLLLFGAAALAVDFLLPLLLAQLEALVANAPTYAKRLDQYVRQLTALPTHYRLPLSWRQTIGSSIDTAIGSVVAWLQAAAVSVVQWTLYLPWLTLIPVIGFFFLKDSRAFSDRLLATLPEADLRWRATNFLGDVSETLAAYIRAQLLACLIIGIITGGGLWLMGVKYSLVLGIVAGLLEFVPAIGPVLAAAIAAPVAGLDSWRLMWLVLGFLAALRVVHTYLIYPRLVSQVIEMHPLVVILALICGAELGGVAGIFLSIPVAALLIVCWKHWRELQLGSLVVEPSGAGTNQEARPRVEVKVSDAGEPRATLSRTRPEIAGKSELAAEERPLLETVSEEK
jgi:predicted PurR-regulated permease PerM